ncbi:CHAD domain-containing protein [Aureimonas sp. AU20]|uniref:CHAD domain-containing protein n=1 Tax=Aureimonas sp. AU20 TaxID=1349819 RepID=UPI00071FCEEA|nr:CHAD domain-containing protein [Aureimonas sp. AU20]ALN71318.1 hypothetical protein M673_01245 [Aureimonas sp. AU20]
MAYRFNPRSPLDANLRRIAGEQIEKAIRDLTDEDGDRHESVHEARKRMKKLRGLLRLVRTGAPTYAAKENVRFRDAARLLSGVRDRTALIEALDGLEQRFAGDVETQSFAVVRTALELKRDSAQTALGDDGSHVAETVAALEEGRETAESFRLPPKRQEAVLRRGLRANYARAQADLGIALAKGEAEAFHDLRKRIKYLSMHFKLLEPAWPEALAPLRVEAETAAEELGRDHDYAVLRTEMAADPESFGARADLDVVLALLDRHQSELRASAIHRCERLLQEKPKAFAKRIQSLLALSGEEPNGAAPPEPPEAERRHAAG